MEQHLHRSVPKNHALFIPEVLVELERKHDTKHPGVEGTSLTNNHHVTLPEQEEELKHKTNTKTVVTAWEELREC